MERNPGVKVKSAFSGTYFTPAAHTNPPDIVQFSGSWFRASAITTTNKIQQDAQQFLKSF
jgi:hypothetical protein